MHLKEKKTDKIFEVLIENGLRMHDVHEVNRHSGGVKTFQKTLTRDKVSVHVALKPVGVLGSCALSGSPLMTPAQHTRRGGVWEEQRLQGL